MEEFILTERDSHRDRSWGVLTKTPRGRGSSPTWFNPYLRVIQMAWVVRGRSGRVNRPKTLRQCVGDSGTIFGQSGY